MNELALFAGAGGGILGGHLLGWRTVCAVEWEPYAASVLAARQNDGLLPPFPIWDDVQSFDGRPWRGSVDVVSGGFPCQDISVAGKGAGIDGKRSGMWGHMARIVGEVRPRYVFVENSPALLTRGLGRVLGDLAALGYDCRWTVLGAADVGAPHQRDRFWLVASDSNRFIGRHERQEKVSRDWRLDQRQAVIEHDGIAGKVAHTNQPGTRCRWSGPEAQPVHSSARNVADTNSLRQLQPQWCECDQRGWSGDGGDEVAHADNLERHYERSCREGVESKGESGSAYGSAFLVHADSAQLQGNGCPQRIKSEHADIGSAGWWATEPDVGRVAHGVAARVDRLKAIGNGQVPLCAATAFKLLTETA